MSAQLHVTGPWAPSNWVLEVVPSAGVMIHPPITNPLEVFLAVANLHLIGGLN